jgi:hypothetical protein
MPDPEQQQRGGKNCCFTFFQVFCGHKFYRIELNKQTKLNKDGIYLAYESGLALPHQRMLHLNRKEKVIFLID